VRQKKRRWHRPPLTPPSLASWPPRRIETLYLEGTKKYVGPRRPDTPLIAFINAKSGGRVGPSLASILYRSLGQSQVVSA
jgi:hypothetical protein